MSEDLDDIAEACGAVERFGELVTQVTEEGSSSLARTAEPAAPIPALQLASSSSADGDFWNTGDNKWTSKDIILFEGLKEFDEEAHVATAGKEWTSEDHVLFESLVKWDLVIPNAVVEAVPVDVAVDVTVESSMIPQSNEEAVPVDVAVESPMIPQSNEEAVPAGVPVESPVVPQPNVSEAYNAVISQLSVSETFMSGIWLHLGEIRKDMAAVNSMVNAQVDVVVRQFDAILTQKMAEHTAAVIQCVEKAVGTLRTDNKKIAHVVRRALDRA